ncbi:hypothetical protein NPIL_304141 [Nephila pilipes]|uniref:Uncharacterized protein n=1 Tax=Nephila pilipes TaxID=299642 RepID=A0A8X6Q4Z1_NEPPI|nr:hypothetical protein NPIL_304141 [Nephila pilipes]
MAVINLYRRIFVRAVRKQASHYDTTKTNMKHDKTVIQWTPDTIDAFKIYKDIVAKADLLAHPKNDADLSVLTSDIAIGAHLN